MNSLISKDGKYVGQYLHIKDSDFSVRMFTKFYNLATHDNDFSIDIATTKDLIHTGRYYIDRSNKIYVNNPENDNNILKSLNVGDYMVFIQATNKIYVFNAKEFNEFMVSNKYSKDVSITYVLGIDDGIKFNNMRVIVANNLENAKEIYMDRYNSEEPICIGIMVDDHLNIITDKYEFSVPLIM